MIILRQYEFGNKANKEKKREWELKQAKEFDKKTPYIPKALFGIGKDKASVSKIEDDGTLRGLVNRAKGVVGDVKSTVKHFIPGSNSKKMSDDEMILRKYRQSRKLGEGIKSLKHTFIPNSNTTDSAINVKSSNSQPRSGIVGNLIDRTKKSLGMDPNKSSARNFYDRVIKEDSGSLGSGLIKRAKNSSIGNLVGEAVDRLTGGRDNKRTYMDTLAKNARNRKRNK